MKVYQEAAPAPSAAPTPSTAGAGPIPSIRQALGFEPRTPPAEQSAPPPAPPAASPRDGRALTRAEITEAKRLLNVSAMFGKCTEAQLECVARSLEKRTYVRGDDITVQDAPVTRFWVMASGYARRLREEEGAVRHVDSKTCGGTISSLSVVEGARTFATARCVTQQCVAYTMSRDSLLRLLDRDRALQRGVLESLSARLRYKLHFRTPLFQQRVDNVNYTAVSIAAAVESYPRSALNSLLNRALNANNVKPLFENMHIQTPARILYISGFKGLRAFFDKNVDVDSLPSHWARVCGRVGTAVAPGVLMTPVSGLLEANLVDNKLPLLRRSIGGTLPRGLREVIFGIGLNQMSDYFTERYRGIMSNTALAMSAGSITAGVVSGYLSHVPHNISTLKQMEPHKPYSVIFRQYVDSKAPDSTLPRAIPTPYRRPLRSAMACLFPRGLAIRTLQICVSFVLLNGTIKLIETNQQRQLRASVVDAEEPGTETPPVGAQPDQHAARR